MHFEKIKSEIGRIAKIESSKDCQKAIRILDEIVNQNIIINKIDRGSYYDFYIMNYKELDTSGKYVVTSDLRFSKVTKKRYKQYQEKIENLSKAGKVTELRQIFRDRMLRD